MSQQEHTLLRDHSSSALISHDNQGYMHRVSQKRKAEDDNRRLNELESELLDMKKQIAKLAER